MTSDSGAPRRGRVWVRRTLVAVAVIAAALLIVPPARRALRSKPPAPTADQRAQAARVHILRDSYGVPHIFGQTDGDAAEGSNAHAVLARRSTDGITRLNINSHQPWDGPVAWDEVQVHSEEGWNMTGSLFPGAPVVLHGHNDVLGWAHTVNQPPLVDVYQLEMNPQDPHQYRFGGKWLALQETRAALPLDLGIFTITLHQPVYRSVHGPVYETGGHFYALRYAAIDRALTSVLQWYRMDKARSLPEWKDAMRLQGIPMFNTVFADQYGASNRPGSTHYADQAPLFLRHQLKPAWRTLPEIRAHLEREYTPGGER